MSEENIKAEARAVAFTKASQLEYIESARSKCNHFKTAEMWAFKEEEDDIPLYQHPASIDDIRRAAEALGYMLCRWEPIETAPMDGTEIIMFWCNKIMQGWRHHWKAIKGFCGAGSSWRAHGLQTTKPGEFPTHWLSGMTAPKEQK